MPGNPGGPVVTTLVWLFFIPREAAGALGARHSPRPPGRKFCQTPGASRRGNNFRRPGQAKREPGPITTGISDCAKVVEQRLSKQATRRMGPGSRPGRRNLFPRRDASGLRMSFPPNGGRGERRVPAAPAAPRAMKTKHTSIVTTGSPDFTRRPHAMVLTVCFVLFPAIGLSCHRRPQNCVPRT